MKIRGLEQREEILRVHALAPGTVFVRNGRAFVRVSGDTIDAIELKTGGTWQHTDDCVADAIYPNATLDLDG